jgi:hypothetical protein
MSEIIEPAEQHEVCDWASGSGSLLLQCREYLRRHNKSPNRLFLYAQESDVAIYNISRINLILHGVNSWLRVLGRNESCECLPVAFVQQVNIRARPLADQPRTGSAGIAMLGARMADVRKADGFSNRCIQVHGQFTDSAEKAAAESAVTMAY